MAKLVFGMNQSLDAGSGMPAHYGVAWPPSPRYS